MFILLRIKAIAALVGPLQQPDALNPHGPSSTEEALLIFQNNNSLIVLETREIMDAKEVL